MQIKYSNKIPPIYYECKKQFGVSWDRGFIFTYGDTVYCKFPIPADLQAHEATHVRQQLAIGPRRWWDRYLHEPEFRLEQEIEAYRNQIAYAKEHYNNKNLERVFMESIASMAKYYGRMCTIEEARKLLY